MVIERITRRGAARGASALFFGSAVAGWAEPRSHQRQTMRPSREEEQAFRFLALKVYVELDSDDTKGAFAALRVFVPAGAGAAPHVHSHEDEFYTVVRGHYRFRHGDEEVDAPMGSTVFMPKGLPHTFRNVGEVPGEHVLMLIPGGLEKLFREVSAAELQLPRDKARYDQICAKYGVRNLPPDSLPLSTSG